MNNRKLLIYDFNELFEILNEIKNEIDFEILPISDENLKKVNEYDLAIDLVITKKKIPNVPNQIILENLPIKYTKFIEKVNLEFLKKNFHQQSDIKVGKYIINLNSREIFFEKKILKLTERECDILLYLSKSKKPISVDELQSNVWGYQSKLETHTVETHIHRLRKKISQIFNDPDFILSKKNGYQIN